MRILCIVSISRLHTILIVICCYQIRSAQIAVCLIKLTIYYICNDLLTAIPNMMYCFIIYCFLNPQTIYVIRITCNNFAIRKPNQLIQTVVSVCFRLIIRYLGDLISVGIISICCGFNASILRNSIYQIQWIVYQSILIVATTVSVAVLISLSIIDSNQKHPRQHHTKYA